MAQAFDVVLIDRVPSPAARASSPTWSTPGSPPRVLRRDAVAPVTNDLLDQRGHVVGAASIKIRPFGNHGEMPERSAGTRFTELSPNHPDMPVDTVPGWGVS